MWAVEIILILKDVNIILPDFFLRTNIQLHDIVISKKEIDDIIKTPEPNKASGQTK